MKQSDLSDLNLKLYLEYNIGETLQFEYYSEITGWTYDEDIITPALIKASKNFRHIKILRDENS